MKVDIESVEYAIVNNQDIMFWRAAGGWAATMRPATITRIENGEEIEDTEISFASVSDDSGVNALQLALSTEIVTAMIERQMKVYSNAIANVVSDRIADALADAIS